MTPAARIAAAAEALDAIIAGSSAEKVLTGWARRSRYAGSKDRAAVRDLVFDALRKRRSLAALGGSDSGRGLMLGLLRAAGSDPAEVFTGVGHAPAPLTLDELSGGRAPSEGAEAMNLPDWLLPAWRRSLGPQAEAIADTLGDRAPVALRVNLAKTDVRQAVAELSSSGIQAAPLEIAETALLVSEGARRLRLTSAYQEGRVELQDAASQAVCAALPLQGRRSVLDYCGGGGGKTLAMAARHPGARYVLSDIDMQRTADAEARCARAGAKVAFVPQDAVAAHAPFDLVLCDVPCSGSGAWRRAPEAKWRFAPEDLARLNAVQDAILDQAVDLVAQTGVLAYVTCSLLSAENDDRVAAFLARHPGWHGDPPRRWLPTDQADGFFLALLHPGTRAT